MWYQNMKMKLIVLAIILALILIIILSVCGGFNCWWILVAATLGFWWWDQYYSDSFFIHACLLYKSFSSKFHLPIRFTTTLVLYRLCGYILLTFVWKYIIRLLNNTHACLSITHRLCTFFWAIKHVGFFSIITIHFELFWYCDI